MPTIIFPRHTAALQPGSSRQPIPAAAPPVQAIPAASSLHLPAWLAWLWLLLAPFLLAAGLLLAVLLVAAPARATGLPGALATTAAAPAAPAASVEAVAAPGGLDAATAVGEITLQIGQAERQRGELREPLARGQDIRTGDILRTSANGHLHILFVDGARVSLRPSSVLHVQEYRYNAAAPADSKIRFYLETGTVREISGRAAELAKERFRLNTPLVAIGVRGTDFVTQVNEQHTAVIVNQGAIVLAPFDAGCQASGLGPCQTPRARELSAAMRDMALIYQPEVPEPVLQPVHTLKGLQRGNERPVPLLQPGTASGSPVGGPGSAADPNDVVSDSRNPGHLLDVVKPGTSLVWGRWAGAARPGDGLTAPVGDIRDGREVTVGDPYYVLYRDPNTPNLLASASGTLNFRLAGASAQYRTPGNEVIAARIDRASLSLDLGEQRFNTRLDISAPGQQTTQLNASGHIDRSSGLFIADPNASNGHVAGALGLDLNQAGYLFQQQVGAGAVSGATLWNR